MNPITEINLELFADYFQIYLQDEQANDTLVWTDEEVEQLLAITDGIIGVGTARNMTVPVTLKIYDAEPEILPDNLHEIGKINECDLEVRSGKIAIFGCTDYFPDAKRMELKNGIYRARMYYGNLEKLSEDGLEGDDFYEIHLWPTGEKQGLKIIKS